MIQHTPYGQVWVAPIEELFRVTAEAIQTAARQATPEAVVALTGGSTPKAFYAWAVQNQALDARTLRDVAWTVSDERAVPLGHADSNFGTARRALLEPLGVAAVDHWPWPVDLPAPEAVARYAAAWQARRAEGAAVYDLCLLGLGEDAHTASIFPGSPLLDDEEGEGAVPFAAVEVPDKGWRLTITPAGLAGCGRIVVSVVGASKVAALRAVFTEPWNPRRYPAQLLRAVADRVIWLVDPAAGAGLAT